MMEIRERYSLLQTPNLQTNLDKNNKDGSHSIMKLDKDSTLINQDATKVFTCHQLLQPVDSNAQEENAS
jgi:hypothetical protein